MSEEIVQPETPDVSGGEGQGDTPYGEYLERLPEDIRGDVEPVFKEWDSNVTKKFQEAADFRKEWEPYQDLNLNEVPRDELENLIALRELAANDPEQFDSWLRETASERGILSDNSFGEFNNDEMSEVDPVDERLAPVMSELEQLREWRESQEQEARVSEAMKMVEGQVEEFSQKHPDVPREFAEQFLPSFAETDPQNAVQLSYEAAEKWIAEFQQNMMKDKLAQPEAAEQGGKADGTPESIKTFSEASQQALARLKQN